MARSVTKAPRLDNGIPVAYPNPQTKFDPAAFRIDRTSALDQKDGPGVEGGMGEGGHGTTPAPLAPPPPRLPCAAPDLQSPWHPIGSGTCFLLRA